MAALRAVSRLSAATASTTWPTYSTLPSASSFSGSLRFDHGEQAEVLVFDLRPRELPAW